MKQGMTRFFFKGSHTAKLDDKNRFVLPQAMRYGLVEDGKLEFTLALGLGGCLAIYKNSDIEKIIQTFEKKQHIAKFQRFFTLFCSTLHVATCDKLGRVVIPSVLKNSAGLDGEIIVAGVMSKIEIWPKAKYEAQLSACFSEENTELNEMAQEAFALLGDAVEDTSPSAQLESLVP